MSGQAKVAPESASEAEGEGGAGKRFRFRLRRRRHGQQRRRRLPFDLRKALFILPNAFTASSIFCGLYAIFTATAPGADYQSFFQAAMAILYAGLFDMFDGRVARLTRTQSDFGVQMDSLADAISFGVAPAILVNRWAFHDLGLAGIVVAFVFCACGVIRLARFNVLSARGEQSSSYFMGLPIPMAAAMVVSLVIAQTKSFENASVQAQGSVMALILVLSYLMVSNVQYYTFKTFRPTKKTVPFIIAGLAAAAFVTITFRLSVTLVLALGLYIFVGLLAEVFNFKQRRTPLFKPRELDPPA